MEKQVEDRVQDLVIETRGSSGRSRYLAINQARQDGDTLVGLHFGELFSVPLAEIISVVSLATGLAHDLEIPED